MTDTPAPPAVLMARADHVVTLTINRPAALNAITTEVYSTLAAHLDALREDPDVRVVVLRGSGRRAFAAGADITDHDGIDRATFLTFIDLGRSVMRKIAELPQPVIAAVQGYALGGGFELALACDLIIASEDASFGLPEVSLGLLPGGGGTVRLGRLVGRLAANNLILRGRPITAAEAHQQGIVTTLAINEDYDDELAKICRDLARRAPLAVALGKTLVRDHLDMSIQAALRNEAERTSQLIETRDAREGIAAFMAKRHPDFQGQ